VTEGRVLIVKTSSLGDVVHALPAVTDLARNRPDLVIDWVVEESLVAVPELHPAVSRVLPVALRRWRRSLWRAQTLAEIRAARARLSVHAYHLIVDCQGLLKSALVAHWAHGPIVGPDWHSAREPLAALSYDRTIAVDRGLHAIERNRCLVAAAVGYPLIGPPRFGLRAPLPDRSGSSGAAGNESGVDRTGHAVLLTNASRASKQWPDAHWRAVEAWLAGRGLETRLFWGSDAERRATERRACGMVRARVMPHAPIGAIGAVLASADVVVGLDTGLTHLAAALGARTIGIYCDYDPALTGVTGDAACVSVGSRNHPPDVDAVVDALTGLLTQDGDGGPLAANPGSRAAAADHRSATGTALDRAALQPPPT
jgi:heptosyltransferase-1